ncbi:1752_t:CDS:2 [Ambispora gerdemannii]|uniref:1752_t:CDS:1 n=1 Tax=Ambispora gerdemannii TaxID=144530 RepID=A0A9N8UWJ8_9GLOM|nr:1752_t:CDS:2 [Ambispora gerdemannii]
MTPESAQQNIPPARKVLEIPELVVHLLRHVSLNPIDYIAPLNQHFCTKYIPRKVHLFWFIHLRQIRNALKNARLLKPKLNDESKTI